MPTFVAQCKDADGRTLHRSVDAGDLADARNKLEALGYREIVFEFDEYVAGIMGATLQERARGRGPAQELDGPFCINRFALFLSGP